MTLPPFTYLPVYRLAHATASLIVHQAVVMAVAATGATLINTMTAIKGTTK